MIKNDTWIAAQAAQGMIQPFEPKLVRAVEQSNGHLQRVISYGLSSYGYDLRLSSREFRVFRHIPGTIVDPKNFNPANLEPAALHEDAQGHYFILPAHSYGLGVALERLAVPENVSVICIGKCLTGDTRILDARTGAYLPIAEYAGGETASYDDARGMVRSAATAVIPQGVKPVFKVKTQRGREIRATANHPFLTKDGWVTLEQLSVGTEVATPRSLPFFGDGDLSMDEAILLGLMISEGQCHTPGSSLAFTSEDQVLVGLLKNSAQTVVNQEVSDRGRNYGYRLVNHIGRGDIPETNRATQWLRSYGLNVGAHHKFVPQRVFTATRPVVAAFLRALFSGDGSVYLVGESSRAKPTLTIDYCSTSRRLIEDVHHLLLRFGIHSQVRRKQPFKGKEAFVLSFQNSRSILRFFDEIGFWPDSIKQRRFEEKFRTVLEATKARELEHPHILWDKIKSIQSDGSEAVYDISVPNLENFVANDLIVHNSTYARIGLIANLTPAEAGWRGHLTLEFSNSSSADCRIYANEGIVQLLFFEGEPCAVSYHTRQGKYQDQEEVVTLAKV